MAEERRAEGRAAYVISQLYYYVAAVIGVALLIGGAVAALFGLREIVLPREWESTEGGIRTMLTGAAFALPGLALLWTHLREARRREGLPFSGTFWGASLYFHLVALIALGFVLIGTTGILVSLVDVVYRPSAGPGLFRPSRSEALRQMLDFAIFVVVAGPVFWWHLGRGRRAVGSP
ncbi:MAG TPA: DUF5671 domain-containing protein [Actinomycetota bacterium]